MQIELCGYTVLIDEEDAKRISAYIWHLKRHDILHHNLVYFAHLFPDETGKRHDVSLHRFIMNCKPYDNLVVDHINGNTLDNRKINLRICSSKDNARNCKIYKNNTSGYKGVHFYKQTGKYKAQINVNQKKISLGYFTDPKEAYEAYCEASKKYHGEYGRAETSIDNSSRQYEGLDKVSKV